MRVQHVECILENDANGKCVVKLQSTVAAPSGKVANLNEGSTSSGLLKLDWCPSIINFFIAFAMH